MIYMIIRRFGFAKIAKDEFRTPLLLKCGDDIEYKKDIVSIMGHDIPQEIRYPPSLIQKEIEITAKFYLIPNINDILRNTRNFVDYTVKIRKKYGMSAIFYAPGAPAHLYPVLFYMGYDIFDDCYTHLQGDSLWGPSGDPGEHMEDAVRIFNMVVRAFHDGKLREFVESIPVNKSQEILRYMDMKYQKDVEIFYPIHMNSMNAVSMNSLTRPDVVRWFDRIKERYRKPEYGRFLLLLPCSAHKPYSESKSHRLMRNFIKSTMHEVVLTSPLGLVPRELERFYPAKNYDIPVIGYWYENEKKIIKELLAWYLERFEYEAIISYLPENMRFLEDILDKHGVRMIWGNNLKTLGEETKKLNYRVSWKKVLLENMQSLARFQFGCCDEIMREASIVGRYPRVDIRVNKERIFGFDIYRGMLTLTKKSANALVENNTYTVSIDDFYPEGDVFAVGVLDATSDIREEDEVAIAHNGELRAWGIARMNFYDMKHEMKGKSVKVRDSV